MMVCCCATTDAHLQAWIEANGRVHPCDSCGGPDRAAVHVTVLAEHIYQVVRAHYQPDLDYPEDGEDPSDLIQHRAGVDASMARRVEQVARDREPPGESPLYDYGPVQLWVPVFGEYANSWGSLKKTVLKRARLKWVALKCRAWFHRGEMRAVLDRLLGDMMTFCGGAAIRRLAPTERIFRARSASSRDEARAWFNTRSDCCIRAPNPPSRANRMNAASTRAFYGALQERIAVAEVQPSIGNYLLVGAFVPTRPIDVLDLGALGEPFDYTSLFDPEFGMTSQRLLFLRMLEHEMSLPTQPAEDPVAYAPTQVVADYVHTVLGLDGLAYRSTQTGRAPSWGQLYGARQGITERNVVLFGGAALTTEERAPEPLEPGLRLLPESRRLVRVTQMSISYERDPGVHYEPPPAEG